MKVGTDGNLRLDVQDDPSREEGDAVARGGKLNLGYIFGQIGSIGVQRDDVDAPLIMSRPFPAVC